MNIWKHFFLSSLRRMTTRAGIYSPIQVEVFDGTSTSPEIFVIMDGNSIIYATTIPRNRVEAETTPRRHQEIEGLWLRSLTRVDDLPSVLTPRLVCKRHPLRLLTGPVFFLPFMSRNLINVVPKVSGSVRFACCHGWTIWVESFFSISMNIQVRRKETSCMLFY